MNVGLALATVSVVKAELVGAVVADRHGQVSEVHDLDIVRMAAVRTVLMVAPMHGRQSRPNDRVWTVRSHPLAIGKLVATPEPISEFQ